MALVRGRLRLSGPSAARPGMRWIVWDGEALPVHLLDVSGVAGLVRCVKAGFGASVVRERWRAEETERAQETRHCRHEKTWLFFNGAFFWIPRNRDLDRGFPSLAMRPRRNLMMAGLALMPTRGLCIGLPMVPGVDAYTAALVQNPLETKVATAAVLAVAGDAIAQRADPAPYDRARAGSFVLFDAAYRGGFQHAAFPWIIEHCRGDTLEAAATAISPLAEGHLPLFAAIECTAFNQLLVVPVVYYPLFFGITGAVQGLSTDESLQRARDNFVRLTLRNWYFWIPAQFCQFNFLEPEWQVPYTCAMGLVWNVILSASAGSARDAPAENLPAPRPAAGADARGVVVPSAKETASSDRKAQ